MKFVYLFLYLFFWCNIVSATTLKLSDRANVSLLTCASGNELYSLFGHSAVWISDKTNNIDIVYNFGTFDFQSKGFYFKFAKGTLPYKLSKSSFHNFMDEYYYHQRSVYAQYLHLDSSQIQMMYNMLEENYLPENRYYYYNFLYDNCSTRIRDLIVKCFGGKDIVWEADGNNVKSFWNLLDEYLGKSLWIQWGIHTILGSPAVDKATIYEQMFLPDYLMNRLDSAYCCQQRVAGPIQQLYKAPEQENRISWYFSPLFVFLLLNIIVIWVLVRTKSVQLLKWLSISVFFITGMIGCLLLFLAFFTIHPTTFPNFNMVWANPLNLVAIYFLIRKRQYLYWYVLCYSISLVLGLCLWCFLRPAVLYSTMFLITLIIYLMLNLIRILPYEMKKVKH